MKKSIFCLLIINALASCTHKNEIVISVVKTPLVDVLVLDKNYTYSSYTIEVKGSVNDTIVINDKYKLCGEIDTVIKTDFYGGGKELRLIYKPYKASKGLLKITHYAN